MTNLEAKAAELEALLFIHGEPLSVKKIGGMLELAEDEVVQLLEYLRQQLSPSSRGLGLLSDGEKVQLVTKPQFASILEGFVKEQLTADLTPASLETLSIISYLGPLSRAKLEYLRGVNSTFTLRSLMIRGLVERVPDPGRAGSYLYKPSLELLKHLGVGDQGQLPEFERFRDLLERSSEPVEAGE